MKSIWLVSVGIEYEGSTVELVLDHPPSQEELDSVDHKYADYIRVAEWILGTETEKSECMHTRHMSLEEKEQGE